MLYNCRIVKVPMAGSLSHPVRLNKNDLTRGKPSNGQSGGAANTCNSRPRQGGIIQVVAHECRARNGAPPLAPVPSLKGNFVDGIPLRRTPRAMTAALTMAAFAMNTRPAATRLAANAPGSMYVDSSCIDCDTCRHGALKHVHHAHPARKPSSAHRRWMAPATYGHTNGRSYVHAQPVAVDERTSAMQAMVACPTGSIRFEPGNDHRDEQPRMRDVAASFPAPIDSPRLPHVLHTGYHSAASFGATPYLLAAAAHGGPNVLVDAPRFNSRLATKIEALGGLDWILLTHMDDVADHERWAARFPRAQRVMHALDVRDATQWPYIDMSTVELQLSGSGPWELAPGLTAIHTPGHSRGHLCFLASGALTGGDGALFTGDHLAYNGRLGRLDGFARYGWDVGVQAASMRALATLPFRWVLPGHGRRWAFDSDAEREAAMRRCAHEFANDPHGRTAPGPVYLQPSRRARATPPRMLGGADGSAALTVVSSDVVDEETGEAQTHECVVRGTTRLETLHLRVKRPLKGLTRHTRTAKRFGMLWQPVSKDTLEMGDFAPSDEPYAYEMPKARVPTTPLARGRFRVHIAYADGYEQPLRQEDVEFAIV
jgi:glyoxylase-like metal-dependent hydrolase (beta-lactamase superfamily II)